MKRLSLTLLLAVSMALAVVPVRVGAETFDNPKAGAVKWKVVDYNRVTTHSARIPYKVDSGIAFDFLNTPDTALLGTSHPSYRGDLIGDMGGKHLSATVGVDVTGLATFTYYGQPGQCATPASVRFYFQTDTSGKFEYTDYWWSNPVSVDLDALRAHDQTIQVDVSDPAVWSDWNGQSGVTAPAEFAAATHDVQFIGLSFGGGCFFENGVGTSDGSGRFRLMDFTASTTLAP